MHARFCQLSVVLVFAITVAASLATTRSTQTPLLAYSSASASQDPACRLYGGACDAICGGQRGTFAHLQI
jgi:hypothetical protein